tara:strand:+ start:166 stop:1002 length:837 start_codon:yes stop_codon:yes gene_type:complete
MKKLISILTLALLFGFSGYSQIKEMDFLPFSFGDNLKNNSKSFSVRDKYFSKSEYITDENGNIKSISLEFKNNNKYHKFQENILDENKNLKRVAYVFIGERFSSYCYADTVNDIEYKNEYVLFSNENTYLEIIDLNKSRFYEYVDEFKKDTVFYSRRFPYNNIQSGTVKIKTGFRNKNDIFSFLTLYLKNWVFSKEVVFLFDDDSTITKNLLEVDDKVFSNADIKEQSFITWNFEDLFKFKESEHVKVRVYGKNEFKEFELTYSQKKSLTDILDFHSK